MTADATVAEILRAAGLVHDDDADPPARDPNASTRLIGRAAGTSFVVAAEGTATGEIDAFARELAGDPDHVVVVMGPGAEQPAASWTGVVPVLAGEGLAGEGLAGQGRTVRLVAQGLVTASLTQVGQRLADELGVDVLAQDGQAVPAPGGALFVPPAAGSGWVRLRPGLPALPGSRRLPTPWWATFGRSWQAPTLLSEPVALSDTAVAEPLPGGAWLRSREPDSRLPDLRQRLCGRLARPDDLLLVVIDYPGGPGVKPSDIAMFWEQLPARIRPWVRFVPFQPPDTADLGQVLADRLGHQIVMYAGLPVGDWQSGDEITVRAVRGDGSLGWHLFASELVYQPRSGRSGPGVPSVASHRAPVDGLPEIGPATYACAEGVVLEVVQCGLWLRQEPEPPGGAAIRGRPADPDHPVIVFGPGQAGPDETGPEAAERLEWLADDVRAALDPDLCDDCLLYPADEGDERAADRDGERDGSVPTSDDAAPAVPSDPAWPALLAPARPAPPAPMIQLESGAPADLGTPAILPGLAGLAGLAGLPDGTQDQPGERTGSDQVAGESHQGPGSSQSPRVQAQAGSESARPDVVVQAVPAPQACVVPGSHGLDRERTWLRQAMGQEYDAASSSVTRLLSEIPSLRGASRTSAAEALSDLVAVRLYLTGRADGLDEAVRAARPGPHVPFARCVASGLRRLPSYRGVARLAVPLTDAQWQWYESRRLVTEWACLPAIADAQTRLPGTVDFWIWSMTARRVHLLTPVLPGQVIFLPGTTFKVLSVRSSERREVLLRELLASEIGPDGQVTIEPVPLDDLALAGFDHIISALTEARPSADLPVGYERRFASAPGLISNRRGRPRRPEGGGPA